MLFGAQFPTSFWVDAFATATHIINRLPSEFLNNQSPFELVYGFKPNYDNLSVFGCQIYPYFQD